MLNWSLNLKYSVGGKVCEKSLCECSDCDGLQLLFQTTDYGIKAVVVPKQNVTLLEAVLVADRQFCKTEKLFLNGFQSWTSSHEKTIKDKETGLRFLPKFIVDKYGLNCYGDAKIAPPCYIRGNLHGFTYAYIRDGLKYDFFGSLCEETGYTIIRFDARRGQVALSKDCGGVEIVSPYTLFDLVEVSGTEQEVFDKYFANLELPQVRVKPSTGYTSWYNYYQNIDEKTIVKDLGGMASLKQKLDIFQIDDGYEQAVGDWLTFDTAKFPNGMKPIATKIASLGYTPGIWLAPFVCETKSDIYNNHPDWLLKDADGKVVYCGCNWSGFYALDFYNPEVRKYIKNCFDVMINDWGFKLFKLDFLYAVAIIPQHNKARATVMFEAMDFLRECVGDKLILGCGVPLAAAFGKVDFCRIGADVTLDWDDKPIMRLAHCERPSTKNTMLNTIYRRQLNGRAFLNDPDVIILRDENTKLSAFRKNALGTVNGLFGGLLFVSDDFGKYNDEKKNAFEYYSSLKNAKVNAIDKRGSTMRISYTLDEEKLLEYKL